MTEQQISALTKAFLEQVSDFQSFFDPGAKFRDWEVDYKREASKKVRVDLRPFVDGDRSIDTDSQGRKVFFRLVTATNFFDWRTNACIDREMFSAPGDWVKWWELCLPLLRASATEQWKEPLGQLLDWLKAIKCPPNISKMLPTYFLFLWDPERHFYVKTTLVDEFLKSLDEDPLGRGEFLDPAGYQRVLDAVEELKASLSKYSPRDNIDVQSFVWVALGKWKNLGEDLPKWAGKTSEGRRRWSAWEALGCPRQDTRLKPSELGRLGLYGGAQGIWVDKAHTSSPEFPDGIAVSVLHTGSKYPDEMSDGEALYHYPNTNRPSSRDAGEIQAVKNAHACHLPIVLISRPTPKSQFRNCRLAWVQEWDDEASKFLLSFGNAPMPIDSEEEAFVAREAQAAKKRLAKQRPGQKKFRFQVLKRYGHRCAVCDLGIEEMLQAAHIVQKEFDGTDNPRNGLVLCANHHAAFDQGLFRIHPEAMTLVAAKGINLEQIQVTRTELSHLRGLPAQEALTIRWESKV